MSMLTLGPDSPDWNERYLVTPDCPGENCRQVAPDGINFAWQDRDTVRWLSGSAVGQAFLFASTSDALAIWNGDQLAIYVLGLAQFYGGYEEITPVNTVRLNGAPSETCYQAAWTPDGRQLAYSDSAGLWLLDVYSPGRDPELLLAAEDSVVPSARYFSPSGRYLNIQRGPHRAHLDVVTRQLLPDGSLSPNERILLAYDTQAASFDLQLCQLLPALQCEEVRGTLVENSEDDKYYAPRFMQVAWADNYNYYVVACPEEETPGCVVDRRYSEQGMTWRDSMDYTPGYGFAYEPDIDYLAVMRDEATITIDNQIFDLAPFFASPITKIEWLPSLLYR
jgi:hypothetical protein